MSVNFDPSLIALPAIAWKQPQEKLDRAVDFADRLDNAANITVAGVTAVDLADGSDATAAIIAATPAPFVPIATKLVQFRIQGGAAGSKYKITVRANGDSGQVAEFDIELNVVDF